MCGRFTLTQPAAVIGALPGLVLDSMWPPRYNIAPGQRVPILRLSDNRPELLPAFWGLAARAGEGESRLLINARAQTVHQKPTFARLFAARRCIVPADGFYEWSANGPKGGNPTFLRFQNPDFCGFAGIWTDFSPATDASEIHFAILTTDAEPPVRAVHHRMPVILKRDQALNYLSLTGSASAAPAGIEPSTATDDDPHQNLLRMIAEWHPHWLAAIPVGRLVNRVANDNPACIQKFESEPSLFN